MSMEPVLDAIDWLKAARARHGWTTGDVATFVVDQARRSGEEMSLTQQAVSNFENANTKSVPRWFRYARAVVDRVEDQEAIKKSGLTLEQQQRLTLVEKADAVQLAAIGSFLSRARPLDPDNSPIEQLSLVPIQSIDLAYGLGGSFTDGPIETEIMHFPKAWVESITSTPPALLTLARGRGDSMIPTIHSGDMVIIDRSQRVIFEPDALWAYTVGEIGGIKRLKVKGDRIIIMSDNKIVPDDEVTVDEINIVGRIAFIGRLL